MRCDVRFVRHLIVTLLLHATCMTSSNPVIGIVSPDAPPFIGGMGSHVGSLIDGFRKEGMTVHVFDRSRRKIMYALGKNLGFSFGLRFRLQAFIAQHHIDILHVHSGPGGVLMPFFPRGAKVVVTANHTYAAQSRLPGQAWKRIFTALEKKTYERADAIIAISEDTALSLRDEYGIPLSRITVIGCGFDLAPWIAADSDSRKKHSCVFVGRPDTRKGWDILRAAWPAVVSAIPTATLSVVGWREESREGMTFLGRIPNAQLASLVGSTRLMVCPSRLEGFGLAAAESTAAGTPVLATLVPGLQRVIQPGRTGILVDPNPVLVAHRIIQILQDDALWNTLHEGCRTYRPAFDTKREISAHLDRFRALYS